MFASMMGGGQAKSEDLDLDAIAQTAATSALGPRISPMPHFAQQPPQSARSDNNPRDVIAGWFGKSGDASTSQGLHLGTLGGSAPMVTEAPVFTSEMSEASAVQNGLVPDMRKIDAPGNGDLASSVKHCTDSLSFHMKLMLEERQAFVERMRTMDQTHKEHFASLERTLLNGQARHHNDLVQVIETQIRSLRANLIKTFVKEGVFSGDALSSMTKSVTPLDAAKPGEAAKSETTSLPVTVPLRPPERPLSPKGAESVLSMDEGPETTFQSQHAPVWDPSLQRPETAVFIPTSTLSSNHDRISATPSNLLSSSPTRSPKSKSGFYAEDAMEQTLGINKEREKMVQHLKRMRETEARSNTTDVLLKLFHVDKRWLHKLTIKPNSGFTGFVDSTVFSLVTIFAILANAAWIGYTTNEGMKRALSQPRQENEEWWRHVNRAFAIYFLAELLLRMAAHQTAFFMRPDDGSWNMYDAFLVLCSVVEEIVETLNLNFLRALRVVRLVRVVRIVRVLRFFSGMRHLMCAVLNSMWVLLWAIMVMNFVMYLFAIFFMQGIQEFIDDTWEYSKKQVLAKHWGSLYDSMSILLCAVSGGLDWFSLVDELVLCHALFRPIFHVYIILVVFGVLNVITGVFVEKTAKMKDFDRDLAIHNEMSVTHAFVNELKSLFEDHGFIGDDAMDFRTFEEHMSRHDVQMYLQTHHIDVAEARELFLMLDVENEDKISIDAFVYGCQRLKGTAKGMDVVMLYEQVSQLRVKMQELMDRVKQQGTSQADNIWVLQNTLRDVRMDAAELQLQIKGRV